MFRRMGAEYLAHLEISHNSYLLVNDMRHRRHLKVPVSRVKKIDRSEWNVNLNHIFNPQV